MFVGFRPLPRNPFSTVAQIYGGVLKTALACDTIKRPKEAAVTAQDMRCAGDEPARIGKQVQILRELVTVRAEQGAYCVTGESREGRAAQ